MLNYALKFGYSFKRWHNVVNVMLEKDPGNPRIHRLRVIHLYEADYNLLLAVKWRQAMHHAEDEHMLNEGLYGSRPGRSAHDPVFLEILQHEIYQWSMKLGINFDLDATSCYDRILACLAAISSRRIGVAKSVVMVNASNLEEAKFKIKTQLGVSKKWYRHCHAFPIHGTGQGSGNSPQIWCFVCSVLFDAFAAKAHGATFTSYDRTEQLQLFMIGFVDDCSQRVNVFDVHPQPTVAHLVHLMEKDAQLWNDLLWASGGALEQTKCSFHCIASDWTEAGEPYPRPGIFAPPVVLLHGDKTTKICQISNYQCHKTLGCHVNPAGRTGTQYHALVKKNEEFARILETNYFTPNEANTLYWSMYLPSVTYPLAVMHLSESDCDALDRRIMKALIPRCGYARTMARAIRYGPSNFGGSSYRRSYVEHGALSLQMAMKFFSHPTTQPGRQLSIAVSWLQAFLGVSFPVFEFPSRPIPPCPLSPLLALRIFLATIDGQIILLNDHVPPLLRIGDRHLMDIALETPGFTSLQLRQIQSCRRFLQVQTLADVSDLEGAHLRGAVIRHDCPPTSEHLRVSHFNQPQPPAEAWTIWRRFLRTISNPKGALYQPLGRWTVPISKCRFWPTWTYNSAEDQLYRHTINGQYRPMPQLRPRRFDYVHSGPTQPPQLAISPVHVRIIRDELAPDCHSIANSAATPAPPSTPIRSFAEFVATLPAWERSLLNSCQLLLSPKEILELLTTDGGGIGCSDGSVRLLAATFGFVLARHSGRILARGRGPAPGARPNSFRSEAYGLLALLRFLIRLIEYTGIPFNAPFRAYLDNSSVIKRTDRSVGSKYATPNAYLLSEWDVGQCVASSIQQLESPVTLKWVKGHQDSQRPVTRLSIPARLNCHADSEATTASIEHPVNLLIPIPLPGAPAQLIIRGESVTSKLKRRVHEAANAPALFAYLEHRFHWTPAIRQTIDFDLFSHISQAFKNRRTTFVKHIHAIAPTGHIAHRHDPSHARSCPSCPCPDETNNHAILCPSPTREQWRATTFSMIRKYTTNFSDPILIQILCAGLAQFHRGHLSGILPATYPPPYHALITQQNDIGWDQVYRGRWSKLWISCHDNYSQSQPASFQLSGSKWALGMGRLLITQWFVLWKQRNDERHEVDKATRTAARLQVIQAQLNALYSLKSKVCPCDRHLFLASAEAHLQAYPDLSTIEAWISMHSEAIRASATRATALGVTGTLPINQAFHPPTPSQVEPP